MCSLRGAPQKFHGFLGDGRWGSTIFVNLQANDLRSFRFCLPVWISSWASCGVFGAAVFERISGRLLQKQHFNSWDLVTWPYGFIQVPSQLNNLLHTSFLETPLYHCMQVLVMFCAIWYHLYNLKNVKNIHGGALLLVKLQAFSLQLY